MTTAKVAEALDVTPARVRQLLLDGEIQGEKLGRDWVVKRGEVNRYRKRVAAAPKHPGPRRKAGAAPPAAEEREGEGGQPS